MRVRPMVATVLIGIVAVAVVHRIDGPEAEAGGQNAVVRGRCSATLHMPDLYDARFEVGALLDLLGDERADTPVPRPPLLVELVFG